MAHNARENSRYIGDAIQRTEISVMSRSTAYTFGHGSMLRNERGELLTVIGEPKTIEAFGRPRTVVRCRWFDSQSERNLPVSIIWKRFKLVQFQAPTL